MADRQALRVVAEPGPGNKISGGRLLSSKTRRSANRAAVLLRIAAVNIGRTQTALGAFYRRLAARTGKAKAVTATARKLAILFYNALRFGLTYADPGASCYDERYRQRVLDNLRLVIDRRPSKHEREIIHLGGVDRLAFFVVDAKCDNGIASRFPAFDL